MTDNASTTPEQISELLELKRHAPFPLDIFNEAHEAYIAAACNLAPALAREVEKKEAERAALSAYIKELYQHLPAESKAILLTLGRQRGLLE